LSYLDVKFYDMTSASPLFQVSAQKKYDLILIDPPWSYTVFGTAGASKHYSLMSQADICALNIKSILKKNAMVLVWATGPRLDYAMEAIKAWGLHYRGIAFVWVKTRKGDNGIISGQGVPPTFTKPTSEIVLCATTKKSGRPVKLQKFNTPQVILAPRTHHSSKPEEIRKEIDSTVGSSIDKLEIFARATVPRWDTIGNAVCGEDISVSIGKLNGTIPIVVQQQQQVSSSAPSPIS